MKTNKIVRTIGLSIFCLSMVHAIEVKNLEAHISLNLFDNIPATKTFFDFGYIRSLINQLYEKISSFVWSSEEKKQVITEKLQNIEQRVEKLKGQDYSLNEKRTTEVLAQLSDVKTYFNLNNFSTFIQKSKLPEATNNALKAIFNNKQNIPTTGTLLIPSETSKTTVWQLPASGEMSVTIVPIAKNIHPFYGEEAQKFPFIILEYSSNELFFRFKLEGDAEKNSTTFSRTEKYTDIHGEQGESIFKYAIPKGPFDLESGIIIHNNIFYSFHVSQTLEGEETGEITKTVRSLFSIVEFYKKRHFAI